MYVIEVRDGELLAGIAQKAADLGITNAAMAVEGGKAIAGYLHAAHISTWFARAYVIPEP